MSTEEFWLLTLGHVKALRKEARSAERRRWERTARVCEITYNAWRGKGQRAKTPIEFVPKHLRDA